MSLTSAEVREDAQDIDASQALQRPERFSLVNSWPCEMLDTTSSAGALEEASGKDKGPHRVRNLPCVSSSSASAVWPEQRRVRQASQQTLSA